MDQSVKCFFGKHYYKKSTTIYGEIDNFYRYCDHCRKPQKISNELALVLMVLRNDRLLRGIQDTEEKPILCPKTKSEMCDNCRHYQERKLDHPKQKFVLMAYNSPECQKCLVGYLNKE